MLLVGLLCISLDASSTGVVAISFFTKVFLAYLAVDSVLTENKFQLSVFLLISLSMIMWLALGLSSPVVVHSFPQLLVGWVVAAIEVAFLVFYVSISLVMPNNIRYVLYEHVFFELHMLLTSTIQSSAMYLWSANLFIVLDSLLHHYSHLPLSQCFGYYHFRLVSAALVQQGRFRIIFT